MDRINDEEIGRIDLDAPVPGDERGRELYYIKKASALVRERSEALGRKLTACTVTFGCQMNARDSEKLEGVLARTGFVLTQDENADFLIYNTCTVRDNADQRVFGRLGRISHYKKSNPGMKVAVCGCMMQEPSNVEKIRKSYPFVDLIFGTHNLYRFPSYLCEMLESSRPIVELWDSADTIVEDLPVLRKYPFKSGINITFGCDNFCTYCIVPYVRGRERSREPREILREVERLAADGVCEVMLLGQNVNSYGSGLETKITFPELLREVSHVDGIRRVRFMTPHPKDFSPELIRVIRDESVIARHVHLPLQAGSDSVLRRMNRKYTKEQYISLAQKIRDEIEGVSITTDIIVGFPGETREDVSDTVDVIERVGFDNAYTFIYSKRRGTPASRMEPQVPADEVRENFSRVLSAVQRNARMRASVLEGRTMEALIEETNTQNEGYVTGRLSNNMIVHVPGDSSMIGHFYPVRLLECRGFYYFGEVEVERRD